MKKAKLLSSLLAFSVAITAAFAFTENKPVPTNSRFNVTAHYFNGADCRSTATAEQSNCSTTNTGNPCTVLVSGQHIDAYQTGDVSCSNEFKQP